MKIAIFARLSTDVLVATLMPGEAGCLKARPDGTVLDGHHRLSVLRDRGVDVDALPRQVLAHE